VQPFTFFISYRRKDTAPIALLLKNEIEKRLKFARVCVDVSELGPGEEFPERLIHLISEAHATIALIGNQWMPVGRDKHPPLEPDWVLRELEFSRTAPIAHVGEDLYGLASREIFPIFVNCEQNFSQFPEHETIRYLSRLHSERIDYANWPSAIGPLIDRMAVRLRLKKRPDKEEYPSPDPAKARTQALADTELAAILTYDDYQGWYVDNYGNSDIRYIVKTFKFPHFNQAADFMKIASEHCRVLDHHPDWRNVFNQVTVSLTTWDAQHKVTIYDLNLALFMNMAAEMVMKKKLD